jgi:2-keto-3-deoxy-L-fuconate dehydrogenase
MRLEGKTVLVTAAGQGIGRASALALAAEGAQVWATDINPSAARKLREASSGVLPCRSTCSDRLAVAKLVSRMPAVDVLVQLRRLRAQRHRVAGHDEEWNFALNLNVRSAVLGHPGRAAPYAGPPAGGSIINMASVCRSIKGLPNRFIYGTTKAAVIGLTKSVAADYVADGIRCNAICPGTRWTRLRCRTASMPIADPGDGAQGLHCRQPMGRLAQAHEIAPLVVFLASDEIRVRHRPGLRVDGGITI